MSKKRRTKAKLKQHTKNNRPEELKSVAGQPIVWLAGSMIVVALIVFITHRPALDAKALLFDDAQYMTKNPLVQNPSWESANRFLTEVLEPSTVQGYYQPLSMISLMLDYGIGGRPDNLRPFHRTSVALHVFNTVLIIAFLYLLFGKPLPAAMVGLLFGVHPITVETMPWVGERKTLLAMFFAMWCLILYVRYTRTGGWKAYILCLLMYVLALMSKPTSTPLPVLLLLLDYWPIGRLRWRSLTEKLPFFVVGGIFAVITIISQGRTAVAEMPTESSFLTVVLTICHNIIFYLFKMVWPTQLAPHYPYPNPFDLSSGMVLAGVVGTCVLIPFLIISLRWTRALLTGWFFFFVAIFPSMGVIGFTNVIASDKFAYLPSIGLLMVLTWLVTRIWNTSAHNTIRPAKRRLIAVIVVLVLAASEAVTTRHQLARWQDTEGLFRYMLTVTPNAASPHYHLATVLASLNQTDEAIEEYEIALRLNPNDPDTHYNLANILARTGHIDDAIDHYQAALTWNPRFALAHSNLGNALAAKGRTEEAITHFTATLKLQPNNFRAHHNLANALLRQGKSDQAIEHYTRAVQFNPELVIAHRNLGRELARRGNLQEATNAYREVLRREPLDLQMRYELGELLVLQGNTQQAAREFNRVLQIDPSHQNARKALAVMNSTPTP